ncbi:MAG TPA: hypothetical protein VMC79_12565 [Rectinemataceae bacterium]|nr:hypothetical protein [Rectinemataceae bacterium]
MKRSIVQCFALVLLLGAVALPASAQTKAKSDSRVAAVLSDLGLKYKVNDSGNFVVTYNQGKGRSQEVFIMSSTETYNDIEIREIWSIAGSFDTAPTADVLIDLMNESAGNKIGDWALEKQDDGTYLLFYTIKAPVEISNAAFQMMLEFAADVADSREQALFSTDDN